jgi:phosphotransferase family enzyme
MCGWWQGPDPLEGSLQADELRVVRGWEKRIDTANGQLHHDQTTWGPILADVGPHNVLWHRRTAWLTDFNDTAWGVYAYDLAVLWQSGVDRNEAAGSSLIDGYTAVRETPPGWGPEMQAAALIRSLRHRTRRGDDHARVLGHLRGLSRTRAGHTDRWSERTEFTRAQDACAAADPQSDSNRIRSPNAPSPGPRRSPMCTQIHTPTAP